MKNLDNTNISNFPEEITEEGLRIYGETSYENQMAVLSHYLHNNRKEVSNDKKEEIILAIREFLSRKRSRQYKELTDEQIWKVAEAPMQYKLFDDFFKVPFPEKTKVKFNVNPVDSDTPALDLLLDDDPKWIEMNAYKPKGGTNFGNAEYVLTFAQYYYYGEEYYVFGGMYQIERRGEVHLLYMIGSHLRSAIYNRYADLKHGRILKCFENYLIADAISIPLGNGNAHFVFIHILYAFSETCNGIL